MRTTLHGLAKLCLGVLAIALSACDQDSVSPDFSAGGELYSYLTADLASQMVINGRAYTEIPADENAIGHEQAGELAVAYLRTFSNQLGPHWEELRGAPINFDRLRVNGPILYAASPFERLPDRYHSGLRNAIGPYYYVPLGAGTDPEILMAVAAYGEATVTPLGRISYPEEFGGEVKGIPIPVDASAPLSFLPPEQVISTIASAAERAVAELPVLVRLGSGYGVTDLAWKVTLEKPVHARANGRAVSSSVIYVAFHRGTRGPEASHRFMAPTEAQPTAVNMDLLESGADPRGDWTRGVEVPVKHGFAVDFVDRVVIGRND